MILRPDISHSVSGNTVVELTPEELNLLTPRNLDEPVPAVEEVPVEVHEPAEATEEAPVQSVTEEGA